MKCIDAHHHLWDLQANDYPWLTRPRPMLIGDPTPLARNYLAADFLADTARQQIVKSVHVEGGHSGADPVRETRWVQAVADNPASQGFPHAIVAFANLADPSVERHLDGHKAYRNVRGIRHILNRHVDPLLNYVDRDYLKDPVWQRNFGLLRDYGLSFDLQIYPSQMAEAARLAAGHPDVQIILNHTGMPITRDAEHLAFWREGMRLLAARPNMAVKLSGIGMLDHRWTVASFRPVILDTIEIFGIDRCAFASNFPVDGLFSDYDTLWNAFKEITADFSGSERAKLFHDNAAGLYRI